MKKKIIEDIAFAIAEFLSKKHNKSFSKQLIRKKIRLPHSLQPFFEKALELLIKEKVIFSERGKIQFISIKGEILKGTLLLHPRGFGFVKTKTTEDIFIPSDSLLGAIDGDVVEVELNPTPSIKGLDGKIIRIISRKRKTLVGTIFQSIEKKKKNRYLVFVPLLGKDRSVILKTEKKLEIGDRILMQIEKYNKKITCSFLSFLGKIEDASKDIAIAIEEYHLLPTFSDKAKEEAKIFSSTVQKKDKESREDLTDLLCFTIDPKSAKDFDDAVSIKKDDKGYHLIVHIADVAHYVKKNSALDKEAFIRGNSTYFPGQVLPMLPFSLSSHLCSLKPNVERLAISIFMNFDFHGNQTGYKISRSVIKNKKRFTYENAFSVLERNQTSPFKKQLIQMKELALLLKKKRLERGSFDFALAESVVEVDKEGNPTAIALHEYDIAHQIIEEFMLKANETIATYLSEKKKRLIYRIHESPSEENMYAFFALARAVGFDLSKKPTNKEIQNLFQTAKETNFGKEIAIQFIKSMKMAFYSSENIGHYGLALSHYCHFTSPIRRYTDLIAARQLFEEEKIEKLQEIASHCSDTERTSMQAQMSVEKIKKLRFLHSNWKKNPHVLYEAIITSIKPFGFFFEVHDYYLEGFIHISTLGDFYRYKEKKQMLQALHSSHKYGIGDIIAVYLHNVDLIMLTTNWSLKQL